MGTLISACGIIFTFKITDHCILCFPHCFVLLLSLLFAYFVSVYMIICYLCNLELTKVELSSDV